MSHWTKKNFPDDQPTLTVPPTTVMVAGLAPYDGPWETEQIAHLLRRCMFGARNTDIDYFRSFSPTETIDALLETPPMPAVPLNDYAFEMPDPDVAFGNTWTEAPYNFGLEPIRIQSLKGWWIGNMLEQGTALREKMVLFWHNHMPIEFEEVRNAQFAYRYLITLYEHAFGNFKSLMRAITLDPGMLVYLNGRLNNASAPDENFARELQELYCIGKGTDAQFTEEDVQAAARVLTGWTTPSSTPDVHFNGGQHDTEDKHFSAFYNKAVILGRSGDEGAEELDELLDMIFAHPETAKHICRKLYAFFVYQHLDEEIEQTIIEPLAQLLRDNDYEIKPVLEVLLKSEHFFDPWFRGAMLKSPLEQVVGMCREMHVEFPDSANYHDLFQIRRELHAYLPILLQDPGDPYDVSGWPAWYQTPIFYKWWISVSTLPKRAEHTDMLLSTGYISDNYVAKLDVVSYTKTLIDPGDPVALVDEITQLFYGIDVVEEVKSQLKSILLSGQANDYYWTDAWYEYSNNPDDMAAYNVVLTRLQTFYQSILQLEEYQLL